MVSTGKLIITDGAMLFNDSVPTPPVTAA